MWWSLFRSDSDKRAYDGRMNQASPNSKAEGTGASAIGRHTASAARWSASAQCRPQASDIGARVAGRSGSDSGEPAESGEHGQQLPSVHCSGSLFDFSSILLHVFRHAQVGTASAAFLSRQAEAQPNHQQPATATAPAMRLPITSSRCSCSGHVKSVLMPRPTPTATDRA